MRQYELVMLISPQVSDEEVSGVVDKVTQFVASRGGEVQSVNPWGRRRLAYHIRNFEEANYVQANFNLDPQHAGALETSLKLNESVLRHLLLKVEAQERGEKQEEGKK